MGLFKKEKNETKCKECGLDLQDPERLKRHMNKAHSRPSQKKPDSSGVSEGGMW